MNLTVFFSPYEIFVPDEAKLDAAAPDDLLMGERVDAQQSLREQGGN
jgi:hypothetical protein